VALPVSRLVFVMIVTTAVLWAAGDDQTPVRFNRDIKPILTDACYHCHGPDPESRKGKLRLDVEEGFFGSREGGPIVVRGKPEASRLLTRLTTKDADELMPPAKTKKVLTAAQIDLVRRWVAQGAVMEKHWSFSAPTQPTPPTPRRADWARTPIDRFVLARLEAAGLEPAPEADRRTLARRLALDLTGLPPTPELVERFVADRAGDAYEKLVDLLLASPRYGEHRARYWLDAARYADTNGLHFDNYREIWPYRDWVIAAFNANQPFDRFTTEQLAGDLLPSPTMQQRIATGFHRCNITTNEGGTIDEENLALYARDRVETTSWVWLGLTANCASCHDHKFDPITAKDFYSLAAYFRNNTVRAKDDNKKDAPPVLPVPASADSQRLTALTAEIEAAKQEVTAKRAALRGRFDAWVTTATPTDWNAIVNLGGPPRLHLPLEGAGADGAVTGTADGKPATVRTAAPVGWKDDGKVGKAARLDEATVLTIADAGAFERDQPASFGAWVRLPKDGKQVGTILARMDDSEPGGHRGWDLSVSENEYIVHLIHLWPSDAIKVRTGGKALKRDTWQHVQVTWDGSGKAAGVAIFIDGNPAKIEVDTDVLKGSLATTVPFHLGRRKQGQVLKELLIQDVRLYHRRLSVPEIERLAFTPRARAALVRADQPKDAAAKPPAKPDSPERQVLFEHYATASDPAVAAAVARVGVLEAEKKVIADSSAVAYVMEEKSGSMPMANILFRGEYDKPRDKVTAAPFAFLHPLPAGAPGNRLGLAQWLMAPQNPLTARVTVNRFWQEIFGTGLVRTVEDFGTMGEAPSHPELLDWLAVEFRQDWDVKKLIRLLVTSATYRQVAVATPVTLAKDAANRLFARGPRFRMDAEMVRDYALSACGLLSERVGGPSVKPYQPEGVWEAVGMREGNTKIYKRDSGEALYRRSIYWFWKRMAPPASLEILNAPSRETSCVRRERTNTPLQALVTLNDPQFVEAARVLAQTVITSGGDDAKRIDLCARRILARPLAEDERVIVARTHQALIAHYRAKPDDAKALIAVGESKPDPAVDPAALAALTLVCNQLLNLDEALNK